MLCEIPEEAQAEPKLTYKHVLPSPLPSLSTVVACIREDESIPHDEKVKFYQDALLHYINVLDGMCEKETMRANSLGPALPSPTTPSPSPQPLASAEWKRCCHRRRESPSSAPLVLAAAESGFPDQSSLNTEIAELFYDKSIPEDVKAELYWIVLRRYNNVMSDEDNVEANPVEVALPPPIPPPRRQKSPPSSLPRQSKHNRRKTIVWEAY